MEKHLKDLQMIKLEIPDELLVKAIKFIDARGFADDDVPILIAEFAQNHVKDELTLFLDFLLKEGYCDSDVYSELPTPIDQYLIFNKKQNERTSNTNG